MAGKGSLAKLDVGVLSAEQQEKLQHFKVTLTPGWILLR